MKLSEFKQLVQSLPPCYDPKDIAFRNEFLVKTGFDPGNIYQELEMDSPIVDTHLDISYVGMPVNLHSHDFFEILYCTQVSGVEYLVGAERYRLQKGDVIMIPPGTSHRPLLPEQMDEPYKRIVIWINGDFMENVVRTVPELSNGGYLYSLLLRTAGTRWESIGDLFEAGLRIADKNGPEAQFLLAGNTLTLLGQTYRAFMDRDTGKMAVEKPQLLDRVMVYIEENLAEKITLAEVAKQFFVSESTVSQLFKKKMGVSFYRCVTQRRLIAAKTMITEGQMLEHVAEKTGFGDYSAFYRAFKQEFGISPRQYRTLQGK